MESSGIVNGRSLEDAVNMFYGPGAAEHAEAHTWLQLMQTSAQAWSFVWDLMLPTKSTEIQFYGANTLHTKLTKCWSEVPKENYEELKQKIMDKIILFGSGPRITLNRLCSSLSAFLVQTYADWPQGIEDVTRSLQTNALPGVQPKMQIWIMMEILCAIPDETAAIKISVERASLRNDLGAKSAYVFGVLEAYFSTKCGEQVALDTHDMETLLVASKCAAAWLRNYAFALDSCVPLASSLVKMVTKVYWTSMGTDGCLSAEDNELTEWCLETLTAMLIQPDANRYSSNALGLIQMFLDSLTPITTAENVEDNQNEDIASAIYTLFVTSIEAHSKSLLQGVVSDSPLHLQIFQRLVQQILQCTDKPGIYPVEESCSATGMGFWYMLQDEVCSWNAEQGGKKLMQMIAPIYGHLARVLVRKAQQPDEDQLDQWSSDDLEMFRCYRQDIADTMLYCMEVLHTDLLSILGDLLKESAMLVQADRRQWTPLESVLHMFCSVAEQVDNEDRKHTAELFATLKEIPYAELNEKVLGTALETIGAFNEWLKNNNDFLPGAIDLLVRGLNSTQASQATLGLKDICIECQLELRDYCEPLLRACEASLDGGKLKPSESIRLMFSVGRLMSMLPDEKLLPSLEVLVSPCFGDLQEIIAGGVYTNAEATRVLFRLNMIGTLFNSLNNNLQSGQQKTMQPVLFVLEKTMGIFKQLSALFIQNGDVIDGVCNSLRLAVGNLQNDVKPILSELCCIIVAIMQSNCCPALVDLMRTCILIFYREKDCTAHMRQLYVELSTYMLNLFDATPANNLSAATEKYESYFALSAQMVKKIPESLVNSEIDNRRIFNHAIRGLMLAEQSALKQVIAFIAHYITQSYLHAQMMAAVRQSGEELVRTIILNIAQHTPRIYVELFADILLALNKKYPPEFCKWLDVLKQPNYPCQSVGPADKDKFVKGLIKEKTSKRVYQAHISAFAAEARCLPLNM